MALQAMYSEWRWAYGGNTGTSAIIEISLPPSNAFVHTTLSMATGGGMCFVGIPHYRIRPDPAGPDQSIDFSWDQYFGYPPLLHNRHLTYVKAELVVGARQQGVATVTVSFFD